jgi:hypothetical protein
MMTSAPARATGAASRANRSVVAPEAPLAPSTARWYVTPASAVNRMRLRRFPAESPSDATRVRPVRVEPV